MMPILPGLCDDDANLEAVVRWTADHGGKFVLVSGLTLADQQKDYFFGVLQDRFPDLVTLYQKYYPEQSYGPAGWSQQKIALRIRDLCEKYGIRDRVPRPIIPSDKRALNKRIVEVLAGAPLPHGAGECAGLPPLAVSQSCLGGRGSGAGYWIGVSQRWACEAYRVLKT